MATFRRSFVRYEPMPTHLAAEFTKGNGAHTT
jgi:hypothetical protein